MTADLSATVEAIRLEVATLRAERDALAAALDERRHEYRPHRWGDPPVESCAECYQLADTLLHRTSRVVLASLTAARPVAASHPQDAAPDTGRAASTSVAAADHTPDPPPAGADAAAGPASTCPDCHAEPGEPHDDMCGEPPPLISGWWEETPR